MKKIIFSIFTFMAIGSGVNAQNVNIPDANFKSYLVGNSGINTNGDTEIQLIEAISFTGTINCANSSISDLTGIENFVALTELKCGFNSLVELDLRTNTNLTNLLCNYNALTRLDLSNNSALTSIVCNSNDLTELDVANGNNSNVYSFYAVDNPNLSCIQVDNIAYSTSNWTDIDATASFSVNCNFPVYVNSNATIVTIPDVNFKSYLVNNSGINTNGDTEIQLTEAFAFTGIINCSNQSINELTGIEYFLNLTELKCGFNGLSSLPLITNLNLTNLLCNYNALETLDLSNNTALTSIICNSNDLIELDVTNGNNSNVTTFYAQDNISLSCIQVDNPSYSTTNWSDIDATASFSLNCNYPTYVNSINVQGQGGVSAITTQGGTLQMEATVLPANADDMTHTWSVVNGTGSANIDVNGVLTAMTDGTVEVTATANDASGETGTATVTISNQSLNVNEFDFQTVTIYPNPVQNELFIELNNQVITTLDILDLSGKIVKSINIIQNSIDVSDLKQGIYVLTVYTQYGISNTRFVKK